MTGSRFSHLDTLKFLVTLTRHTACAMITLLIDDYLVVRTQREVVKLVKPYEVCRSVCTR